MNVGQSGASVLGINLGIAAMMLAITLSNVAFQYPIDDGLTYCVLGQVNVAS